MKRFAAACVAVSMLAILILAGCGKPAAGGAPGGTGGAGGGNSQAPQVEMDATNFVRNNATYTIKTGEAINFVDPASTGGIHILCFGKNGVCDKSQTTGPKELQGNGFQIDAGQTKLVTFDTAGTYDITCSIHPIMQITVTVQ